MSQTSGQRRRTLLYSGNVQGVGFRYTTASLAQGWPVRGFVQNLPDGRVKLVVEGEERHLNALEKAIHERLGEYIANVTRDVTPPRGEFTSFEIRR